MIYEYFLVAKSILISSKSSLENKNFLMQQHLGAVHMMNRVNRFSIRSQRPPGYSNLTTSSFFVFFQNSVRVSLSSSISSSAAWKNAKIFTVLKNSPKHKTTINLNQHVALRSQCALLYYFTLSKGRRFYLSRREPWHSMVNPTFCPWVQLTHQVALRPDVPYFTILLCLTPDDFTKQGESTGAQLQVTNS